MTGGALKRENTTWHAAGDICDPATERWCVLAEGARVDRAACRRLAMVWRRVAADLAGLSAGALADLALAGHVALRR